MGNALAFTDHGNAKGRPNLDVEHSSQRRGFGNFDHSVV
jgi:hypothetical protein